MDFKLRAMNKVNEVKVFKTADGNTFDTIEAAEIHQAECEIAALVTKAGPLWNDGGVTNFILSNAEALFYHLADMLGKNVDD